MWAWVNSVTYRQADVLRASLVIFVASTTGQGDMPKNTRKFWKNLRREKLNNTNCLKTLRFCIFGLGDSSYLKYVTATPLPHPDCLLHIILSLGRPHAGIPV